MPPLQTPGSGPGGYQPQPTGLTANQMGRQILPYVQPSFPPVDQVTRVTQPLPTFTEYATSQKQGRPYADVGKFNVGLPPSVMSGNVAQAQGAIAGFGSALGRRLGGVIGPGQEQGGADIGQGLGGLVDIPLGFIGGILGNLPDIPFLPGGAWWSPGSEANKGLSDQQRAALSGQWDGNPNTLGSLMGELDKQDFQDKVDRNEINPILAPIWRPSSNLGDQIWGILDILTGIPARALERTVAGGALSPFGIGERERGVLDSKPEDLNPQILKLREDYVAGKMTKAQFYDQLAANNAGYSNDWATNMIWEGIFDPTNLAFGAGAALGFLRKTAAVGRIGAFADGLSDVAKAGLRDSASKNILETTGQAVTADQISPAQMFSEAERLGTFGDQIAKATSSLPARYQFALSPAFPRLEKVADLTQKILDPVSGVIGAIGQRGTKAITNAYVSRKIPEGVARAVGLGNFSKVSDLMERAGRGDIFTNGMAYASAQIGVLVHGDTLMNDVVSTRRISDVRPTKVLLARAKVGAENLATKVEGWYGKRMTDLAQITGSIEGATKASLDKLGRLGFAPKEALNMVKGLDWRGHSLIHLVYYGNRIESYNIAKTAAKEALNSRIAAKGVASAADDAAGAVVDRLTLIGPEELTGARAKLLREALGTHDAAAAQAARDAIHQYDVLAYQFVADAPDAQLVKSVLEWLDNFDGKLTEEIDPKTLKSLPEIEKDLAAHAGDGYSYGLRPDGEAEWRTAYNAQGDLVSAHPWVDIVPLQGQPEQWNLRFRNVKGTPVHSFANWAERVVRGAGAQITTDRIDREIRHRFIERAMVRTPKVAAEGGHGRAIGLSYNESRALYQAVKDRAIEASTTPRGLMLNEFEQIVAKSPAAMRINMSGHDLMTISLQSFEGNIGTVGLTQKLTGRIKTVGRGVPFMPENSVGMMAERMYPMVRFALNPVFQMQELVEPWFFSAARGHLPIMRGFEIYDPVTQKVKKLSANEVDVLQQHMIARYRASSPEAQFDMMERSLVYFHGQKAAKEFARSVDQNQLKSVIKDLATLSPATRKHAAQSERFRTFLGPMLEDHFNKINPNIWPELEKWAGTKDKGVIAVRWLTEKDKWSAADPRIAYHLYDAGKPGWMGATATVNLEENAKRVFDTTREALNQRVIKGYFDPTHPDAMTRNMFADRMRELGAEEDYIGRTWKVMQLESYAGGIDGWLKDFGMLAGFGKGNVKAARSLLDSMAAAKGISPSEMLAQQTQHSPMSLFHDDFLGALPSDLEAMGVVLHQSPELMALYWKVDPVTGGVTKRLDFKHVADEEFLRAAKNSPSDLPAHMRGQVDDLEKHNIDFNGRKIFVPGGQAALADLEKPWTLWEAHVIRSQIIDPGDLKDELLKHALFEKMWRGHTIDMADPGNIHALFNNYAFAINSAQMNLTRNELVSSRFRVGSTEDLNWLADDARSLATTINEMTGKEVTPNDLGLAYSTNPDVAAYIPHGNRRAYDNGHLLPDRWETEIGPDGVETRVHHKATSVLIEEHAATVDQYLQRTNPVDRARHRRLEAEGLTEEDLAAAEEAGGAAAMKPPKKVKNGPMFNWGIDEIAKNIRETGSLDGLRGLKMGGVQLKVGKLTPEEVSRYTDAAAHLAENIDDVAARKVIGELAKPLKEVDKNVILKQWNVNQAGLPRQLSPTDGAVAHSGVEDTFAYLKNPDVAWRSTGTNANMGRTLLMAINMTEDPSFYVRRTLADGTLEPLDVLGERISHRTNGLSLKTGFFGIDLGDPMGFNRGVHDVHMVGDMVEYMYGRNGKSKAWKDFYAKLSPGKQTQIDEWIAAGHHSGAGAFKWSEAAGDQMSLKPGKGDAARLAGASDAEKAAWVKRRLDLAIANPKSKITQASRDRLDQMYRTDAEWADLVGRDIKIYGGDYKVFEDAMTARKAAAEAVGDDYGNMLKRHGNGGYQWKLWDERRHIWDPETSAFADAHGLPRRSLRLMASSDDAHQWAGFMDPGGMPSINTPRPAVPGPINAKTGKPGKGLAAMPARPYSYLDLNAAVFQRDGKLIRGATITTDTGEKLLGITQYKNATTGIHELLHVLNDSIFDPSGRRVVWEDLNRVINAENADILPGGATYEAARVAKDAADTGVADAATTVTGHRATFKSAQADAVTASRSARATEDAANALDLRTAEAQGKYDQLVRDRADRIHSIASQKIPPSDMRRKIATVDRQVDAAKRTLDTLIEDRDLARQAVAPAWDAASVARETATAAKATLDEATTVQRDLIAAQKKAQAAFDEVSTKTQRPLKFGWDTEVEHHFIDEFQKWMATGRAPTPKMRDAFAYFRKVLVHVYDWVKGHPEAKVSPEMEKLFTSLVTPAQDRRALLANAVPFDATDEMLHAAGAQAVSDAENAAFTNVQFKRSRSWIERSINHPYLALYPASYMWGKVLPEMIRALTVNPFGLPVPFLTKPVKINGIEFGLHGTPFYGFANAARVNAAIELQMTTDPEFKKWSEKPEQQQVWRNLAMFAPGTPWELPANMPLWFRRTAEYGLKAQEAADKGTKQPNYDPTAIGGEVLGYAFGPLASANWLGDIARWASGPKPKATPQESLSIIPGGARRTAGPEPPAQPAAEIQRM